MYSTTSIGDRNRNWVTMSTSIVRRPVWPSNRHATELLRHLRHDYEHQKNMRCPVYSMSTHFMTKSRTMEYHPRRDAERDLRLDYHVQVGPANVTA